MKELLLVFLGGGLGSVARYLVGKFFFIWQPNFPFATLSVNFLSCLIFGAVMILGLDKLNVQNTLKLLLLTGFCGGFSTYSTFTFETIELYKSGQNELAAANIVLNFALSVSGIYLGALLIKSFI